MRFHQTPRPLLQLIAAILSTSQFARGAPSPFGQLQAGFSFNELFGRAQCGGTLCGYYDQLCCAAGSGCYTDINTIVSCTPTVAAATPVATAAGGYWTYYTTTYVETDLVTTTKVMSSYVGGVVSAAATPTAVCGVDQPVCGNFCCASNQYCGPGNQCLAIYGGASGSVSAGTTYHSVTTATGVGVAPILPTGSSSVTRTVTASPTVTSTFIPPAVAGGNITLSSQEAQHSGLSGGAIAGIVIGVLLGLALLALLIFCCCLRGLWHGLLAIFGMGGKKRKRTTEIDEYERRSHHASGGGERRTWYGGVARPPARVDRRESSHKGREAAGIVAGLGALWAILGLKRQRDNKRRDEKHSEYSYSSDYYTSASSASSEDRRTHATRYSRR